MASSARRARLSPPGERAVIGSGCGVTGVSWGTGAIVFTGTIGGGKGGCEIRPVGARWEKPSGGGGATGKEVEIDDEGRSAKGVEIGGCGGMDAGDAEAVAETVTGEVGGRVGIGVVARDGVGSDWAGGMGGAGEAPPTVGGKKEG